MSAYNCKYMDMNDSLCNCKYVDIDCEYALLDEVGV